MNLASRAGQEVLAALLPRYDVLSENFKLGTLDKWGFADAWFERHAPRLVRCSITGYGSSGPRAPLPGYDFILQAESGLMSICGEPEGKPTKYGVAIVDVCTGMLASNSILAALNARQRTGQGQKVELSLYETSLAMLVNVAASYLAAGRNAGRFGNGHPSIVPYTTYQTADALIALSRPSHEWVTLRVPYPMGAMFTKGVSGRIDDPKGGWKGRGLWANSGNYVLWHIEGGKGTRGKAIKFQLRPDPLAK